MSYYNLHRRYNPFVYQLLEKKDFLNIILPLNYNEQTIESIKYYYEDLYNMEELLLTLRKENPEHTNIYNNQLTFKRNIGETIKIIENYLLQRKLRNKLPEKGIKTKGVKI